ncbi:MAG: hypothetical protein M3237_16335 [Actinomycetota bacterium]|nr:hypothetical protein [Actinomycetota bacterium]
MRLAVWVVVLALTACDPGDDVDVDPADATARLEAQRTEVRDLVATLATKAAAVLDGRVSAATGHSEGCASVFPEGHRSFRYLGSARVEAGPVVARPYLDALGPALEEAGLTDATLAERPGGRTLDGTRGGLEVRWSELPGQGDYVLLDVSGPCVDVPEDERAEWEGRPDPTPIVD